MCVNDKKPPRTVAVRDAIKSCPVECEPSLTEIVKKKLLTHVWFILVTSEIQLSKRLMRAFLQDPSAIVENKNDFPAYYPVKFLLQYEPAVTSFRVVKTFERFGPLNA